MKIATIVKLAICWIALVPIGIAAQPPEIGAHEVSVWGRKDASGNFIAGDVRITLGCRVRFDDETWRLIKQHDKVVTSITIETPFLTDDVIQWLSTLEQLQEVHLDPNFLVDATAKDYAWNLTPLESLKQLQGLRLVDMRVSDSSWLAIGRMRNLKGLSFYRCRIDSHGSLPLANLKELVSLVVDFCNVDDRFFAGLHQLPRLRSLRLAGGSEKKFTVAAIQSLATTNLTGLYLDSDDFGSAGTDALNRISSLEIIEGIADSEAVKFEKHPNLLRINKQVRSKADGSPFVDPDAPGERRWVLRPSDPVDKKLPANAQSTVPIHPNAKSKAVQVVPLVIETSDGTPRERVKEFAGRKDVLKIKASGKSNTHGSISLEVPLPNDKEILVYQPDRRACFYLSFFPPLNGSAKLMVSAKQRPQSHLFLGVLNKLDERQQNMIERIDGWVVVRIPLMFLDADTTHFTIELTVDGNASGEVYWATPELRIESNVTHEEADPTKQTLFQSYLDRASNPYGRLVDAATGKVLKEGIGIGWSNSPTSCLFSSDGSHVAVVSKHHDNHPSNSTNVEKLWLFALRPFRQLQETESSRFTNIRFAEDNTALLFTHGGPAQISGK